MLIIHAVLFDGKAFRPDAALRMANGRITACGPLQPLPGETVLDLAGDYLLPGFVDVHIHGFLGQDAMGGEASVRAMSRALARAGVAAFCPTTMSASPEATALAMQGIQAVMDRPEANGARVLGAHLEAPFLQESRAGAQNQRFFSLPDWQLLEKITNGRPDSVRLLTLAPELPGSEALIRRAVRSGIHVSIGHTSADAETVHRAADWGADHVTHLFNAQSPLHHRAPGVPGASLTEDRLFCEMICDGIHLHPDIIRLALRCKGPKKAVVITDAMEAAGMPDGQYQLGGRPVRVSSGEARLEDGTLAGSVLTMPKALENLIHHFHIKAEAACAMCTLTPAASVGEPLAGRIRPGAPAILTRWTPQWRMVSAIQE